MKTLLFSLLLLFPSLAPAQVVPVKAREATYTTYGKGCGGLGLPPIIPRLWATGLPKLGGTFRVHYQGPYKFPGCKLVGVGALLLTGVSRDRLGSIRLPWRVPPLAGPFVSKNCFLLTSAEVLQAATFNNGGLGFMRLSIPNNPSLLGRKLYQQWYLVYGLVCGEFMSYAFFTNGGIMTIGV